MKKKLESDLENGVQTIFRNVEAEDPAPALPNMESVADNARASERHQHAYVQLLEKVYGEAFELRREPCRYDVSFVMAAPKSPWSWT